MVSSGKMKICYFALDDRETVFEEGYMDVLLAGSLDSVDVFLYLYDKPWLEFKPTRVNFMVTRSAVIDSLRRRTDEIK